MYDANSELKVCPNCKRYNHGYVSECAFCNFHLDPFELKEDQPTIADAFFVYNSDLEKCITVSREQGDDIIDVTIHNEMDIATARVFCEKLSSFLRGL